MKRSNVRLNLFWLLLRFILSDLAIIPVAEYNLFKHVKEVY